MNSSLQETYTQLWNEHVQSVRNFCYAKLKGRPDDAEDMLHDAFRLLWEKMLSEGVPPNPKAWLLATVNNLALIQYRHTECEKNNRTAEPFDEAVMQCVSVEDVAERVEKAEINEALWKVLLEELNDEERLMIWYDTVEGIPQAQIAELMGKSYNSTRVRIHRLRQRLRQIKREKEKNL
ncbi:MAG: sigma-70 family RNA polymerase sigma factor [Clostridia bacterium]|nr:sigma-70 family RNA polymerase sigma factor [Clostridia bacterium]